MPLLPRNPGSKSGGKPGGKPGINLPSAPGLPSSSALAPAAAGAPRTPPPAAVVKTSAAAKARGEGVTTASSGPAFPESPVDRVRLLLSLSARLTPLLEQEAAAFQARRWREAAALQEEKRTLVGRYDDVARLVRLDKTGLARLSPDLLDRLTQETARLDTLAHNSAITLERGAEAQRRVLDVTVRAANQSRTAASAYIRARSPGPPNGGPGQAVTLDQRL